MEGVRVGFEWIFGGGMTIMCAILLLIWSELKEMKQSLVQVLVHNANIETRLTTVERNCLKCRKNNENS